MVLAELGQKITQALKKLNQATVIDEAVLADIMKDICNALMSADINLQQVLRLRENVKNQVKLMQTNSSVANLRRIIQRAVVNELSNMLDPGREPYEPKKGQPNIIMFVGLQGSGKTTTCTKLAYHYQRKGWRVALVCADTFRAGAFDQLRQNAAKIKIPFIGDEGQKDPVKVAMDGVEHFVDAGFEIIIVDTSGKHKQEEALFQEMIQVAAAIKPDNVIFVMDSSIGQACYAQATAFQKAVKVGSVIITKLDGHAKGGGALSAIAATQSPIIFIGTGEHFDDLEEFKAKSFIQRLLGLGDLPHLFEVVKEAIPQEKQKEMMEDLSKGIFTFKHLKEQLQGVLNMGSMSQVMSMIPGFGSNLITKGKEKESAEKIKRYLYMLDSMNTDELEAKKPLIPTRIERIARGSGTYFLRN
jgi:signal recognition particle subunit SRP54